MSSEISSLSITPDSNELLQPLRPGPQPTESVRDATPKPSSKEQKPPSLPRPECTEHKTEALTTASDACESDAVNARFYQPPTSTSTTPVPHPDPTIPPSQKRQRPQGPIDTSYSVHPNGLANIQVQTPGWRGHSPLGVQVPKQLMNFGKFNLRYEAAHDLTPDAAFDRRLHDSQQSLHANHYADQDPNDFPHRRAPSPPLPQNVMQNLQLRTLTMVNAYGQAQQRHLELGRREADLDEQVQGLHERLAAQRRRVSAASGEHAALREALLERGLGDAPDERSEAERATALSEETVPLGAAVAASHPAVLYTGSPTVNDGPSGSRQGSKSFSSMPSDTSGAVY